MTTTDTDLDPRAHGQAEGALRRVLEQWGNPPPEMIEKLPRLTCKACKNANGKVCDRHKKIECPKCGSWISTAHVDLDYLGHAGVTKALIEVDPFWNWELGWGPRDDNGAPFIDPFSGTNPSQPTHLFGELTVLGVTRKCVGTVEGWKGPDTFKELIGDMLRNGAMRFGIGTALWSKAEWNDLPDADPAPAAPAAPAVLTEKQVKNRLVQVLGDVDEAAAAWAGRPQWLTEGDSWATEDVEAWIEVAAAQRVAEGAPA